MEKWIYLNNSATTYPKPENVILGIQNYLRKPPFHHARTGFGNESEDIITECRKQLASLFNATDPARITFSSGATESLNTVLQGLQVKGRHIVTTAIEHNSVLRPLKTMERDGLVTLSIVPCEETGSVSPHQIEKSITGHTAAIVVNHCSNVTGTVIDIEAIGHIARNASIPFIVDASQSAGVYPIDIEQMNIDALVFTGHKSLFGLQGCGGAFIREGIPVKPLKVGGTGVRSDYLFQPETVPMFYEAGTQNIPGIVSMYYGVRYIFTEGIASIRKRKETVVSRMKERLSCHRCIRLIPPPDHIPSTLFSFTVAGLDPADIGYILEHQYHIVVRTGLHCAPLIHEHISTLPEGTVRVSPSHFTTDKEIDLFGEAMENIVKMAD